MRSIEQIKERRAGKRAIPSSLLFSLFHALLLAAPAFVAVMLVLRFGMRLLGVRYDVPLPGAVYAVTGPVVEPFYRWFPASPRFDYYALEWASLAAAGAVIGLTVLLYVPVMLAVTHMAGKSRGTRN